MEQIEDPNLATELPTLTERLKQTQDKIRYWVSDELNLILSTQTNKHESLLKEYSAEKEKLKHQITNKQKEDVATSKKLEEKCKQLSELKAELEQLCSVTQRLNSTKSETEAQIESTKKEIEEVKRDIAAPTEAKQKLEYLQQASKVFGSALGLTFRKTKGSKMQILFNNIDEKDPLMTFYFFLQIHGTTRKYVVMDPEPPIEGVEELVARVNETNDFRQFIIDMRQKFKETVKKSESQ